MTTTTSTAAALRSDERSDLLATLAKHRGFLRYTVRGLTDEQAGARTTASELCLGGIIKHVAETESHWVDFLLGGAEGMKGSAESGAAGDWAAQFRMLPNDTLVGALTNYQQVASRTDRVVADLADLDVAQALPVAPWFEPGAAWSGRRVLLHLIAETAQHAGHADILRESLDGATTMS